MFKTMPARMMSYLVVLFLTAWLAIQLPLKVSAEPAAGDGSADDGPGFLKNFPGVKELESLYPDSDAIVLCDSTVITLDEAGRITRRRRRAVVLLTDNAIRRYGDPRILYDTGRQELDILGARVYMLDGTAVDTKPNGFNLTTPFPLALAPDYTNWQEMVVTHVGIEKGCIAELHYAIRDRRSASPWLSGIEYFETEDPSVLRTLEICVPRDVSLKHVSLNGMPEPESPSRGVYTWNLKGTRGRAPVDGGVWSGDYLPAVCYSTAESWEKVLQHIASMVGEAARDAGELSGAVGEAIRDIGSDEERILRIHGKALDCVRSVAAPFALFSDRPRDARRIYTSAYAHSLDRAVLLIAMLREAGFEAVPVFAALGKNWPGGVPAPEVLGKILLAVHYDENGDEELFLDPGTVFERDPRIFLSGVTVASYIGGAEIVRLPERSPEQDRSSLDLKFVFDEDGGIVGEGVAVLSGIFSPYYLIRGVGEEMEDFIGVQVGHLFGGASPESWNLRRLERESVEIGFHFKAAPPEETAGGRLYVSMPEPFESALSGVDGIHLERSFYPVPLEVAPCVLEVKCAFNEPAGWRLVSLPPQAEERNSVGSVETGASSTPDEDIVCSRRLVIEKGIVGEVEYGMLRSLILEYMGAPVAFEKR